PRWRTSCWTGSRKMDQQGGPQHNSGAEIWVKPGYPRDNRGTPIRWSRSGIVRPSGPTPARQSRPLAERDPIGRQRGRMRIWPGTPYPLGATWDGWGTNFALFSEVAERVELCLFDEADDKGTLSETR